MRRRSHLTAWLLLCLAVLLVGPWWAGPERLAALAHDEIAATHRTFGPRMAAGFFTAAADTQVLLGHHRIEDLVRTSSRPAGGDDPAERYLSVVSRPILAQVQRYVAALRLQCHTALLRALALASWCLLLIPLCLAAMVDGWVQRAVKVATLGYQNPAAFAVASHLFIGSAMFPMAALMAPFAVPPWFMPLWLAGSTLPLRVAIAHMQPVFTR